MSRATLPFSSPLLRRLGPAAGYVVQFSRTDFYREEFLRHQRCLDRHREYFSEQAIHDVEHALQRILARLDTLCVHQDCDKVIGQLLK
ncbi:MAG: hypothetical protein AB7I50_17220, partial [Vicinamibacterales bacterium]